MASPKTSHRQTKCVSHVWEREYGVTWWKLHLPEAFDWRRDAVSINQDMKLLPDALISGVGHVQDVAWCLPAIKNIQVIER